MKLLHSLVLALAGAGILAGCAAPGYPVYSQSYPATQTYPATQAYPGTQPYPTQAYPSQQSYYGATGVVDSIRVTQSAGGGGGMGAGAIVGGVVGGLLGHQVGGGSGKTAATVAGTIGGAMVGNQMERNTATPVEQYQVGIRLDNGTYQTFIRQNVADLQVGARVRIENNQIYRY